jgi:hypothetical protein
VEQVSQGQEGRPQHQPMTPDSEPSAVISMETVFANVSLSTAC